MIQQDSSKSVVELREFAPWFESQFADKKRCWLSVHEGAHVLYSRECGHDPKVSGPSWVTFQGERRHVQGAVEGLSAGTELNTDPAKIGKWFLGPAHIEELLWPERFDSIWSEAEVDTANFNEWYVRRHDSKGDIPRGLKAEIRVSVRKDLSRESFREALLTTAIEYESRVFGEQPKPVGLEQANELFHRKMRALYCQSGPS